MMIAVSTDRLSAAPVSATLVRRRVTLWELLVWTYRDQKAHVVTGRGLYDLEAAADGEVIQGVSGDGCAVIERIGLVGGRIDGGPHAALNTRLHPDAEAVHDAVLSLAPLLVPLVIQYSCADEQPERSDVQPHPFPTRREKRDEKWGRAVHEGESICYRIAVAERMAVEVPVYDFRGRGRRELVGHELQTVEVLYCPLDWWPSPALVDHANAIADAFDGAIKMLAVNLEGVALRGHVLTIG